MNLLQSLRRYGQSVWLDGFERGWISRGELQQYIDKDTLRGVRSNFQSLQAAIQEHEYDRDFSTLAQQGMSRSARAAYDYLIVRDIQLAADLLKETHVQTQGRDGYTQVNLPPDTLFEAATAIAAAQNIWQSIGWSNLLVEIPATQLMLPVITQLISDRINVNATLVFSPSVYEQIFDSYLRGLERLMGQGESVNEVVCFVSVAIGRLDAVIAPFIPNSEISFGVMQAKLLYQHYRNLCRSERQRSLPGGAKPLRLVWDCTDVSPESAWRYLQALVVPETVMLLSPLTLERYREVSLLLTSFTDDESAETPLARVLQGIALDECIDQLLSEEMARSLNTFDRLLEAIDQKRRC
ncbi:MAG: transaldolase family protein [Nostoc sp.]|uniref:transaldolase family protein n=1 Tax=Nostoc sp. TaxID=1180 RepID=UPI002FF5A546